MSIQQMLLGAGGAAKKTYVDDVFSTYVYTGNGYTNQSINNGIDLAGEGGMTWFKLRNAGTGSAIMDTERGASKYLRPYNTDAEATDATMVTSFNNNGFSLGNDQSLGSVNYSSAYNYASWTFRKAPGFFDVVTYTGNGEANQLNWINHNLGCVPGLILIKCTSLAKDWVVYHKNMHATDPADWGMHLNTSDGPVDDGDLFYDTEPTATAFNVRDSHDVNKNGETYVAYVFAGGESTAATAKSVDFDGTGDSLTTNSSSDYTPGTSDFTLEYWYNPDENAVDFLVEASAGSEIWSTYCNASGIHKYRTDGTDRIVSTSSLLPGQWYHIAVVRISNTVTMYINGIPEGGTYNDTNNYTFNQLNIGKDLNFSGGYHFNGKISNLRFVVGTGVYTSAFRPPTEPLTNITNTKLLCCNSSSVTGATVGTITSNGDPTVSIFSPFDDPAGFKFGDTGDQNIIKCGGYIGNGSNDGPEIYIGWEPQFLIIKYIGSGENWRMFDNMRGVVDDGHDKILYPSLSSAEASGDRLHFTATGFKLDHTTTALNKSDGEFIYIAIRRPDGYVGKPAAAGTDVFAMDTGSGSTTIPNFDSGFPVDFAMQRSPGSSTSWYTSARLIAKHYLLANDTSIANGDSNGVFDSNVGWFAAGSGTQDSSYQSWMWKRHAGFDVVTYTGTQVLGRRIPHNLSKAPEMVWIKDRDNIQNWAVGHKDLNGGSSPWNYYLQLNEDSADASYTYWHNESSVGTAPTSTHVTIGSSIHINKSDKKYIMMLFASIDGICKVGSYTGNGTSGSSTQTITTGFQPRFVIVKSMAQQNWYVLDTTNGWQSGNDNILKLNTNDAEATTWSFGQPTSTGFTLDGNYTSNNENGTKYIYYAHA